MRLTASRTFLLAALAAAPLAAQAPARLTPGEWVGSLSTGAMSLRLGFSVRVRADGALEADLDSYDQGAMNIPVDSVRIAGDSVRFFVARIGGGYRGALEAGGRAIAGTWWQGGGELPLRLALADSAMLGSLARRRPQEPKPPLPYRVEELSFESAPGVRLAGTLVAPPGAGPHPAVVLVSGSGPQDRDETLLGHKPFLVLADHLVRRGIAVLRYDDRGTAKSTGSFATATSMDFGADARAAVAALRARPDVRADAVGIVGHSEGGLIAPIVAADSKSGVAFIVMLAGPGVPGSEILSAQSRLIGKAMGLSDTLLALSGAASRRMYEAVRTARDTIGLRDRLRAGFLEYGQSLTAEQKRALQWSDGAVEQQIQQIMAPWFRTFLAYDPRPTLRTVRVPVLALNGTLDLQVPPEQNLPEIEQALRAAGNRDVTIVRLPGLNHLFQTAKTGAPAEYASIEETFAPDALQRISDWITARFKPALSR
ncbi:MAG TPA: alpha/beta fold hydrolase [Gemmatimonadaceae bacterium]|nr:alpha/beta fold hydrolase [Gemmatimonadaceae bacterium]